MDILKRVINLIYATLVMIFAFFLFISLNSADNWVKNFLKL